MSDFRRGDIVNATITGAKVLSEDARWLSTFVGAYRLMLPLDGPGVTVENATVPEKELRAAVARLRCEHDFRFTRRGCTKCGADVRFVVDELAEPLAAWLEEEARHWDAVRIAGATRPDGTGLAIARVINGGGS